MVLKRPAIEVGHLQSFWSVCTSIDFSLSKKNMQVFDTWSSFSFERVGTCLM